MRTNKSYAISSLATQLLVTPIILTLLAFGLLTSTSQVLDGFGSHTRNLIIIIAVAVLALASGALTGILFNKLADHSVSSKTRFYTPLVPVVAASLIAALIMAFTGNNFTSELWNAYILKNPLFFLLDLAFVFSGLSYLIPIAEVLSYLGYAATLLASYSRSSKKEGFKLSNRRKLAFAAVCAAAIALSGFAAREPLNNGLIEVMYGESTVGKDLTEYDLTRIAPFKEGNGLAKLDKEATLQFLNIEEMPRLDGATAAYPVYAAFVEAVYRGLGQYYLSEKDGGKDTYTAFVESEQYPFNIIKCSKTGPAYQRLMDGETDIIFAAEPSKEHLEMIAAQGDEFLLTTIGYEAFVFFTNVRNPVENLTITQIQDIYSGKIENWKSVGGRSSAILAFQRPENSGSQTVMQNKVMRDIKMQEPTKETRIGGMGGIISEVASYKNARNAMGYSFMYYSSSMVRNNQIKYLAIEGIKPTPETVRNKAYPFTVPVYAVTLKSNSKENVQKFIDWILSEEGQSLIEKTGYIPTK